MYGKSAAGTADEGNPTARIILENKSSPFIIPRPQVFIVSFREVVSHGGQLVHYLKSQEGLDPPIAACRFICLFMIMYSCLLNFLFSVLLILTCKRFSEKVKMMSY